FSPRPPPFSFTSGGLHVRNAARTPQTSHRNLRPGGRLCRAVHRRLVRGLYLHLPRPPSGDAMKVDLYERFWMFGTAGMLTLFFASLANGAIRGGHHPPSHVETIDPAAVMKDARFRTQGVRVDPDGRVHAWVVGLMFVWLPAEMTLPADTPVTFHLTAVDVIHGFEIVRSN